MKTSVLVNEASRILRNCSNELEWEDKVPHLNYFAKRMQYSGYPKETRYKVMKRAIDKYDEETSSRNTGEKRFTSSITTRKETEKQEEETSYLEQERRKVRDRNVRGNDRE